MNFMDEQRLKDDAYQATQDNYKLLGEIKGLQSRIKEMEVDIQELKDKAAIVKVDLYNERVIKQVANEAIKMINDKIWRQEQI